MTKEIQYIKKVKISKLWGKYDISWNLHPDVNILAGANGSGKSTILSCTFGSLMNDTFLYQKGIVEKTSIVFNNEVDLHLEYIKVNETLNDIEKKAQKDMKYEAILSDLKEREGKDYGKKELVNSEGVYITTNKPNLDIDDILSMLHLNVINTFDSQLPQSEAVKKLSDDNVKTDLDWIIYQLQKEYLSYQLNISRKKDQIVDSNSENISEAIKILRKPQNRFLEIMDTLFHETGKKINRAKNEISFLLDDEIEISAYQLSSGEKQLLLILLTVLIQDNQQSILFMDEPEVSLHIEWQKKLIGYIRELNPNVQIIIATHSPALIMEGWLDKVTNISDIITKTHKL